VTKPAPEEVAWVEPESQQEGAAWEPGTRRRKRKKRRRVEVQSGARIPRWVWWWGSLAAAVVLTIAGFYGAAEAGYPITATFFAIRLAFAVPISIITFTVSLFVSNWFGAGTDLVEFGSLIPKSLLLVLLASLVGLMPCVGLLVGLGVWLIGAVIFFKLEAWEARFLVGVNFVLGVAMWVLLIPWLLALVKPPQ
jgi:hypothetical protein